MDNYIIFKNSPDGFDKNEVVCHFASMISEFHQLEEKYLQEKRKNKKLREKVKLLKQQDIK